MSRFMRATVVVVMLGLAAMSTLAAQGTVRGRVSDSTGAGLANVTITVDGTALRAASSASGEFTISGVPAGQRTLRVRLLGYEPAAITVEVTTGGETRADVTLAGRALSLSPLEVVVGSRARHTAAEELAVPVDVFTADQLEEQGSNETSIILQQLSPAVNFPRQSVTDATDIVRPFTLRGLSPDHTLVLVNGVRRHQMAVVNTFAYGTAAGSSGVDLNTIPSSALERVEVLRDGASAQYGSDAIAGVVNVVLKEGPFTPFLNVTTGGYVTDDYPDDGNTFNVNGGFGFRVGRGSLSLFADYLDRDPTNRAWADPYEDGGNGQLDSVSADGKVIVKRNPVPQPNHHWGDGMEQDLLTMANLRLPMNDAGTAELYGFAGYSTREGSGNGYRRYATNYRNFTSIYPLGYLPEFHPDVTDYSLAGGLRTLAGGWSLDIGGGFGHNDFEYNLRNTLNASLGPCLDPAAPCAPGADSTLGTVDDPGIPNQTSFFAGRLTRDEFDAAITAARQVTIGLPAPVSLAVGAAFRSERFQIEQGETASWIDGGHRGADSSDAPGGSQVFPGFSPSDEADESRSNVGVYADLETDLSPQLLVNVAGRFESYSDFGERFTGKAALRFQPSPQLTLRGAASTGFRAPGLGQSHFSKVVTNVIGGVVTDVGVFPVGNAASQLLGAQPLQEETSLNLSAGAAFSPKDNLTFTLDLYQITIDDRIMLGATFDDSVSLAILANAGYTSIGGLQYFTNGLDTKTTGLDLTADWRTVAGAGVLHFIAAANFTDNEITRVSPLPQILQDSGSTEPGIIDSVTYIGITDERPDWRATVTGIYGVGRFSGLLRWSYYGKFSSAQPGYCDLCRDNYGAKNLFDAELGYRFGQVTLVLGARNLFDVYPDQPSSTVDVGGGTPAKDYNNNFGTFPWAAASPFGYNGRYVYARMETTLGW